MHTCVLKSDGNVDCYGSNTYGQADDYTKEDGWQVYDTSGSLPNTLNNMTMGKGYLLKSSVEQNWTI